jgi:hypothetical protein
MYMREYLSLAKHTVSVERVIQNMFYLPFTKHAAPNHVIMVSPWFVSQCKENNGEGFTK